jgi:GNAT superfamily N-acetyltransferase
MECREIRADELDKILKLYTHLHDNDFLPEPHIISQAWDEIQGNKNIKYFGVFDADALISSCAVIIVPNLTRSCCPYGVIENVVTRKDYRRKGYGKSVLKAAIKFAWEKSCYKVMLMTGRLNEETFRFYESAGFDRNAKQAFVIRRT